MPTSDPGPTAARSVATVRTDGVLLHRCRGAGLPEWSRLDAASERALVVVDAAPWSRPLEELPLWRWGRWAVAASGAVSPRDPPEHERTEQLARMIGRGPGALGAAVVARQLQLRAHPDAPNYPGALLAAAVAAASAQLASDGLLVATNGRVLGVCAASRAVWVGTIDVHGDPIGDPRGAAALAVASHAPASSGWERIDRCVLWWDPTVGLRVDQLAGGASGAGL